MKLDASAASAVAGLGAVVIICTAISVAGVRPPGEAAMLKQIELEDSYLCETFGMEAGTRKFWNCVSALADLRKRHMEMVASYELP